MMTRRWLLGLTGLIPAGVLARFLPAEARPVSFDGAALGGRTTFFHPDPNLRGVFGFELDLGTGADEDVNAFLARRAIDDLKRLGLNAVAINGETVFRYGAGGPGKHIVYLLVPPASAHEATLVTRNGVV